MNATLPIYTQTFFVRSPFGDILVRHGFKGTPMVTVRTSSEKPQTICFIDHSPGCVVVGSPGGRKPLPIPRIVGKIGAWLGLWQEIEISCVDFHMGLTNNKQSGN